MKLLQELMVLQEGRDPLKKLWTILLHPEDGAPGAKPYPKAQVNKLVKYLSRKGVVNVLQNDAKNLKLHVAFNDSWTEDSVWDMIQSADLDDALSWGGSVRAAKKLAEDFEEKSFNEGLTSESRSFREEPIPPFAVCYSYDGVVHKDDVFMGSRAECLKYMRTHKAKKPFTFDLMDTDSGRLVSFSLKEAGRTFTIKKPGATPEDELDDAQVVLEAQSDSKRLASQNVEAILHTKDQIQRAMRLLKARGGEDKALSNKIVALKARLKKLTEGKLTESFARVESMLRDKMISRVEGFFGDLQSLRYDQLNTEDLAKIFFTLVEKNLVKSVIIAGFGEVAKAEDLERFLGA